MLTATLLSALEPPPISAHEVLAGLVLPAVFVGVALVVTWGAWRRHGEIRAGAWAGVVGAVAAMGFAWAYRVMRGGSVPNDASQYVYDACFVIAGLALLDGWLRPPMWLRAILVLLAARIGIWLLLLPLKEQFMPTKEAALWVDGLGLAAMVWWLSLETLAEREPGVTVPAVLAILGLGTSIFLSTATHSATSGNMAGVVVAMSVAALVVAGWAKRVSPARGAVLGMVLPLLLLGFYTMFYGEDLTRTGQICGTVLLVSPLLAWAGDLPGVRRQRPWVRVAVRVVCVLLAVGYAAGASLKEFDQAKAASGGSEQGVDE